MHTCAGSRVAILTHAECAAAAAAFRTACGEDHLEAQGSDAVEDSHWAGTKGCHVSRWVKNNNWVSRHNIAGIWVAFFSRCQRKMLLAGHRLAVSAVRKVARVFYSLLTSNLA